MPAMPSLTTSRSRFLSSTPLSHGRSQIEPPPSAPLMRSPILPKTVNPPFLFLDLLACCSLRFSFWQIRSCMSLGVNPSVVVSCRGSGEHDCRRRSYSGFGSTPPSSSRDGRRSRSEAVAI
ncbi:hypothetical protein S245_047981 [Arachis hypogaea]